MSSAPRQQERAVFKLMSEISVLDASWYAVADQVRTGDCLELQQVRGARIVPTGDQAVDHAALRCWLPRISAASVRPC
jgi:hypothetical protein